MKLSINNKQTYQTTSNLEINQNISIYDYKSDNELWNELTKGSEEAFNHIYRKYVNCMYNYGAQFTDSKEILKDTIQTVFINIRKGKEGIKNMYSIKGYLFKSLKREIIKKLEKENRYTRLTEDSEKFFAIEVPCEQKIINSELQQEEKKKFKFILNQLTVKQREGVILYYQEGLTYKEVAEILSLKNSKSARKLIYRALECARKVVSMEKGTVNN